MSLYAVLGALSQGLVYALMALGVYLTFRVLDFPDLTVDGSLPLGAAVAAVMITKGLNPFFTLPVAFAAGMAAGFVTAFLSTKLKILNLLASILTMIALYSINIRIMGKPNIPFINQITIFDLFPRATKIMSLLGVNERFLGVALSLTIFALIVVGIKIILDLFLHTDLGLALRATGDNENMIRAQGVNTHMTIMLGVALSNGLVALCGALVAQDQGLADVTMGVGTIVAGLASVIIGEALLGEMTVFRATLGVVIGSIIYRLAIAFALSLRIGGFVISPSDLKLITAILVVFALMFPTVREKVKIGAFRRGGGR
ncbi:MAG: ABC transporter permease [Deltaproteobacteria bacterium]|uniref:ABC transporter permease n=1 Tax=Candidatus Zymogenus saltonus TaxID=2844893 RepID=A0A9D8KGH9_9DELT|nr:ABC transporter permease [Candidatus Zymogenus saltonus]